MGPLHRRRHHPHPNHPDLTFSFDSLKSESKCQFIRFTNQKLKGRFLCSSTRPFFLAENAKHAHRIGLDVRLFQHTNLVISAPMFAVCPACPSLESPPYHRSPARCLFYPELHLEHCRWSLCEPMYADFGMYINCPRHGGITKQHVNKTR